MFLDGKVSSRVKFNLLHIYVYISMCMKEISVSFFNRDTMMCLPPRALGHVD